MESDANIFIMVSIFETLHSLLIKSHTLSGRIGKVVASHAAVAHSIPVEVELIYTMHEVLSGYCH